MKTSIGFFNSNNGTSILGFGCEEAYVLREDQSLQGVQDFMDRNKGAYLFIALSYDLKNSFENLTSNNIDETCFPLAIVWKPSTVIRKNKGEINYVQGEQTKDSESFIASFFAEENNEFNGLPFTLQPRISRDQYLKEVNTLKEHIQQGDIYEVNYCQEFYAKAVSLERPIATYFKWNSLTKAPYSSFLHFNEHILISGSPERFIRKEGNKVISSPIKGTRKRGFNEQEDEALKKELLNDPKERGENVMIVDLVRNDLSKIAQKNTVNVDELFGIYSFETVHQMISTISCTLRNDVNFLEILKATFPMGSMTGAPKINAMDLIEKHEHFKRGIYSGSVGFMDPNGNFDLNVVIRSLVYNDLNKYVSCSVGGAITDLSNPEMEFEECEVKIQGILKMMYEQS